jgi:hypothetical protein
VRAARCKPTSTHTRSALDADSPSLSHAPSLVRHEAGWTRITISITHVAPHTPPPLTLNAPLSLPGFRDVTGGARTAPAHTPAVSRTSLLVVLTLSVRSIRSPTHKDGARGDWVTGRGARGVVGEDGRTVGVCETACRAQRRARNSRQQRENHHVKVARLESRSSGGAACSHTV